MTLLLVLLWRQPGVFCRVADERNVILEKASVAPKTRQDYSPDPIPVERRNAALQLFEQVHPTLTIHYHGFSRSGSLICYDMMNEIRTVEEATALMYVEYHLLDLMLEHYKVSQHMRIVDATFVRKMLTVQNLNPVRLLEAVAEVTKFISMYEPLLRTFLDRYLKHIELLVIVNVPSILVPILPAIASRIMGIPPEKIAALSSGRSLDKFMDRKYVPKEFGNPNGLSVKSNREEFTASCLMLQEIKTHLEESESEPNQSEPFDDID
ncbi:hypothetical protein cyc_05787 [Cyclospora cayetanensis]|uniref:CRAL-TRIO domain-containing protein n=1 Tax=Cyclospora cayetanensis TaxID=88456 RepID=A0A1D3D7B6_9EIME|nr:hypothetical protein cyc_05787 [Cyclospora cayetanensis]